MRKPVLCICENKSADQLCIYTRKAQNSCSETAQLITAFVFGRHNANMSVQYTAIFHGYKNDNFQMKNYAIFLIFAQNIDCRYTLEPPLTSTHNLCFEAKIRK